MILWSSQIGVSIGKQGASHGRETAMTHLSKGDSPAKAALRAAGWIELAVETGPQHYDAQGHLNNAAIAQLCNDMRLRYRQVVLGPWWERVLHEEQLVVAAREAHFSFDSEGLPGEAFVGVMRYSHREGKAAIAEQRIMESRTGRVVARGWVLLLVIRKGLVIDWPEEFFEHIAWVQGAPIERRVRPARTFDPG